MEKLYTHTEEVHNTRSAEIVLPVILDLIPARSVLDVGCGTGTWLKVFNENFGIADFLGLDGSYIEYNQLTIDRSHFKEVDLRKPFDLQRKFDLVLCLEVAEHLPETSADDLVASLCKHGDTILFSAAIPGQGGQNHVNEQWPAYWEEKFLKHGFYFHDMIRPVIWNDNRVNWWYKQNIFIATRKPAANGILTYVHPQCFIQQIEYLQRVNDTILSGGLGVKNSVRILFRSLREKFIR